MESPSRMYLARHGQVKGYETMPIYGHTDIPTTEIGMLQARHLAERLRFVDIGAIYSSDLDRASSMAYQIGRYHDVPVRLLPRLREMNFGDWEGTTLAEIRHGFPEELEKRQADLLNYSNPGGGESLGSFSRRVTGCFEDLRRDQPEGNFVIVAHAGVNRVIICNALGLELEKIFTIQQDYGCLNIIDYFKDSALIRLLNG